MARDKKASAKEDRSARTARWFFSLAVLFGGLVACIGEMELIDDTELGDEFFGAELPVEEPVPPGTVLVHPEADGFVRNGKYATKPYGTATTLQVDGNASRTSLESYVRFLVPAMSTFKAARLRFFVTNSFRESLDVSALGAVSWDEATLTYNTRPTGGTSVGSFPRGVGGTWIEVDVTGAVSSGQPVTFRVSTTSSDGASFSAREASANRPELRLVVEGQVPPMPGTDAGVFPVADAGTVDGGPLPSCLDAGTPAQDAGTPDAGTVALTSFANEILPIFGLRCVACHGPALQSSGLNLSASTAWSQLVNVPATCSPSVPRVKPSDPAGSMLWRKLSDAPDKCGLAMPASPGLKITNPTEFNAIEKWIREGARNN